MDNSDQNLQRRRIVIEMTSNQGPSRIAYAIQELKPKSQPCRACGAEGLHLCDASPALKPGDTVDPSSLPTYDQIAGWLGAEWVVSNGPGWAAWVRRYADDAQCCLLRHAPSGQRVEVTAPTAEVLTLPRWEVWFDHIKKSLPCGADARRNWGSRLYAEHVRWLDPDTKDFTGSEGGEAPDSLSREPSQATPSEPVIPPRCSSCKQPFWAGRPPMRAPTFTALKFCGDCLHQRNYDPADHLTNDLDTRIAEVAEPEVRIEDMPGAWQTPGAEGES